MIRNGLLAVIPLPGRVI